MAEMADLTKRKNKALHANPNVFSYPTTSDITITTHGSNVYWAITAVMALATIGFMGWSFTIPRRNRIFHYITASITLVAAVAYFTMASNLGYAPIAVEFQRSNPKVAGIYRGVFYVRYIDWFVTTPLLLLDLLLTAGLPWPTILFTMLLDEVMIVSGLVGSLVTSSYKWGYFVFATFSLFGVAWNVMWIGRKHASALGPIISKTYMGCGVLTMFLWFLYPIAWGLSEGGNIIAPDSEAAFYSVLDVFAKVGFGLLLLNGHRNIDPALLGIHIRDYDDAMPIHEKSGHGSAVTAHNGQHGAGVSTGTDAHPTVDNGVVGTHANQSAV